MDYVLSNNLPIDLHSGDASSALQTGCPDNQCQVTFSLTLSDTTSYVEIPGTSLLTDYLDIRLSFQTRQVTSSSVIAICSS